MLEVGEGLVVAGLRNVRVGKFPCLWLCLTDDGDWSTTATLCTTSLDLAFTVLASSGTSASPGLCLWLSSL